MHVLHNGEHVLHGNLKNHMLMS